MSTDFKYSMATALLQQLCREERGNFVFSPISLGTCLAMVVAGLEGESKTEVLNLIKCPDEDTLHSVFEALLEDKQKPLEIANKCLIDKRFEVKDDARSFLQVSESADRYVFAVPR